MEVLVCEEGFIHTSGSLLETEDPDMEIVDVDYDFSSVSILDSYGLPQYRYINEQVVSVTNPLDYQLESSYWEAYVRKCTDETIEQIKTLTNDELKAIYDASPSYKQEIMYQQIEFLSAQTVPQVSLNLTFEVMIRCMAEYFHIKEVQQRNLTTDETAAFNQVLSTVHDHSIGMGMPMSESSWFQGYLSSMMLASDQLRTATLSKRLYITGRL